MIYASTFMSHSSVDKPLVENVAQALGRRGVIAWLDTNELLSGASLSTALKEAVHRQATVTVFLSPASVRSRWVEDELVAALQQEDASQEKNTIIPIYLSDDPVSLVSSHPLLSSRWLHPDGDRVDRLGIIPNYANPSLLAQDIAQKIARRVYSTLGIMQNREVIIYLDQRGTGLRRGEPANIPENIRQLDAPALVFRSSLHSRNPGETLDGQEFQAIRRDIEESLGEALSTPRWSTPKKIRILGNAQLALPFILGRYFNRNTTAHLFCANVVDGKTFNNQDQQRAMPLQGGNPYCQTSHPAIQPLPANANLASVSLLLSIPNYVTQVIGYLNAHPEDGPLLWVESKIFENSAQVMQYVADIVALLTRLRNEYGINTVHLYCGLPFHVVPLLAANLLHVIENIVFMEYRRDLQGQHPDKGEIYSPIIS